MPSRRRTVLAAAMLTLAVLAPAQPSATAGPLILLEADSGRVLYAEDADHQWFPASLTKIMTAYLAFEAIKAGRLSLTDTVTVSENAHVQPPSKIGLPVGGEITVELALRALIVKSANDVAVMLAEKIAGTEDDFIRLMNDTARRLGMTRTRFANPHGLPAAGQISTARDLARLGRAVLRDFPEHQAMWAEPEVRVGKQVLRSHNGLLRHFEGADGIKTGFICDSGFNVVSSATRDGRKLMAVVLGEPSGRDRNLVAAALLDHGFETGAWKVHLGVPTIDTMRVDPGAREAQSVRLQVVSWNCGGRKPVGRIARGKKGAAQAKRAVPKTNAKASKGGTRTAAPAKAAATAAPAAKQ